MNVAPPDMIFTFPMFSREKSKITFGAGIKNIHDRGRGKAWCICPLGRCAHFSGWAAWAAMVCVYGRRATAAYFLHQSLFALYFFTQFSFKKG